MIIRDLARSASKGCPMLGCGVTKRIDFFDLTIGNFCSMLAVEIDCEQSIQIPRLVTQIRHLSPFAR
jgi:hypothetical protein